MSEKRFEKSVSDTNEDFRIYDNWKEDAYFISCDDEHTVECLVKLMNEQQDTINKQEKEIDRLRKEFVKVIARQIPNNYAEYRDKYGKYDRNQRF